jgi:hypothetical protein
MDKIASLVLYCLFSCWAIYGQALSITMLGIITFPLGFIGIFGGIIGGLLNRSSFHVVAGIFAAIPFLYCLFFNHLPHY